MADMIVRQTDEMFLVDQRCSLFPFVDLERVAGGIPGGTLLYAQETCYLLAADVGYVSCVDAACFSCTSITTTAVS